MSEEAPAPAPVLPSAPAEREAAASEVATEPEVKEAKTTNGAISNGVEAKEEVATHTDAPVENSAPAKESTDDKQPAAADNITQDQPSTTQEDIEMKDASLPSDAEEAPVESSDPASAAPASAAKAKTPRRKSGGVPEHKGKKLNKKASAAKLTHTDAQPGDYFYVRLKGYPLWPAIVCNESMLPNTLIKSRPVTAARPDGSYRSDYEDGGPKAKDRTFPVMYLHTNEFGWIPNYDLVDLDFDDVATVTTNMRKDLAAARQLAAEKHDLDYFKEILKNFMEAKEAERAAKEAAKAEKKAKKAAASKKEKKSVKAVTDDDEDVEMADAIGEPDSDEAAVDSETKKATGGVKRKADGTPQRTESVKKPKTTIKLNTPKTNGTSTPKSAKETAPKSAKSKTKKAAKAAETPEVVAPKEPELTAEEKRAKKEKEILFLRHKLQKGLLTRDQEPKEEEMKSMSEFVSKLEGYADLEVSIIRATKINKVLKAILKMASIPKEEEFHFKTRSQSLLDKWNKLLAVEQIEPTASATTNGVTTEAKAESEDAKPTPAEATNGTKESSADEKAEEEKVDEKPSEAEPVAPPPAESKDAPAEPEDVPAPSVDEPAKETNAEPAAVEASA
ncbi:related to SRP40-suppressor of mutant AC40 of RNA polymerase I and III [Phialocephala subalpina]|uniref:Related to SRP40-suppressor of mutant AC40 of RNA polymerase I and III n=1 Tax=Phialocephala subalpina TaxID=576137 RepID=A0A1L7WCK5_9HELO|nr:related to SRP40-suppressor of mutant AC40 of RNA polymerase I and III [Phialocephala subalpina]